MKIRRPFPWVRFWEPSRKLLNDRSKKAHISFGQRHPGAKNLFPGACGAGERNGIFSNGQDLKNPTAIGGVFISAGRRNKSVRCAVG